jgi:glyoxylase-like metal-dependent hydrolase (beta-lactamase superfamily II)
MLQQNVAPGVHRVEDAYTNWYLVEDEAGITIVDAGVPTSWGSLKDALRELGREERDLKAIVLTHAHFDHIGFAERAREQLGIPVYVHENDYPLTKRPRRFSYERRRILYFLANPQALPVVGAMLKARALWPRPIKESTRYRENQALPVPGEPQVVYTPGHTLGHCALHLPDRDVLFAGDAIVMRDPYTAEKGPKIVSRAATADSARNLSTLDAIRDTGAGTILTGHGEPWTGGAAEAVRLARERGAT